jgi:hypothetical protein
MLSVSTITRIMTAVHHLMLCELEDYVVAFEVRGRLCATDREEFAESTGLATESARSMIRQWTVSAADDT